MQKSDTQGDNAGCQNLYRLGAIAPLVTLALYLIQTAVIILGDTFWEPFPATVESWLLLFQHNKILGLIYLNTLDILSISLLAVMFLALYKALEGINKAVMTIAAAFSLLGITVFVASRSLTLSVLGLSDQYAAATTDNQRSLIAAAARAIDALGIASPQTTGFFFMAVAVLLISLVMLKSGIFNKAAAGAGLLAALITFTSDASLVLFPSASGIFMAVSSLFWVVWYVMMSIGLFSAAGNRRYGRSDKIAVG